MTIWRLTTSIIILTTTSTKQSYMYNRPMVNVNSWLYRASTPLHNPLSPCRLAWMPARYRRRHRAHGREQVLLPWVILGKGHWQQNWISQAQKVHPLLWVLHVRNLYPFKEPLRKGLTTKPNHDPQVFDRSCADSNISQVNRMKSQHLTRGLDKLQDACFI